MSRAEAWSYSSLNSFETCARRHYLVKIAKKVVEPQGEALVHGNEVHKALELAVEGTQALPAKYASYIPIVDLVRRSEGVKRCEQALGVTKSFRPTDFWAPDVWFRCKIDLSVERASGTVVVVDWKTGKPKFDGDQLKLSAAAVFAHFPRASTVHTGYAWLGFDKLDKETYTRDDVPAIWQEFLPRIAKMDKARVNNDYPPSPGGLCTKWCPVTRQYCQFSGRP